MLELESCVKGHLEGLVSEIATLAGHARPPTTRSTQSTCWSTNTEEVNVALTVIKAVCQQYVDMWSLVTTNHTHLGSVGQTKLALLALLLW